MNRIATLPADERGTYFEEGAWRLRISAPIVEKDFWVCWLLGLIFSTPQLGGNAVFKGGASLSKVFGVINRFSEDVDLGLSPESLGHPESEIDEAPTKTARAKRAGALLAACAHKVETEFLPVLEKLIFGQLGGKTGGRPWLRYELEEASHSPVIFRLPDHAPESASLHSNGRENRVRLAHRPATHGHAPNRSAGGGVSSGSLRGLSDGGCGVGSRADILGEGDNPPRGIPPPCRQGPATTLRTALLGLRCALAASIGTDCGGATGFAGARAFTQESLFCLKLGPLRIGDAGNTAIAPTRISHGRTAARLPRDAPDVHRRADLL